MRWPASIILSLLDEAQANGSASAEVATHRAAWLARTAIYNYRRRWLEAGDERQTLSISVEETTDGKGRVTVMRVPQAAMQLVGQGQ